MSILLKCAACGYKVPFQDEEMSTEAICPSCEVLLRRRSEADLTAIPVSMELPEDFEPADLAQVPQPMGLLFNRTYAQGNSTSSSVLRSISPSTEAGKKGRDSNLVLAKAIERLALAIENAGLNGHGEEVAEVCDELIHQKNGGGEKKAAASDQAKAASAGGPVPVLRERSPSNGKTTLVSEDGRALPMSTPVLVRQEAAAEAHRFRRGTQDETDSQASTWSPITDWVEEHPVFMMMTGLSLLIALVVMTTLLMEGWVTESDEGAATAAALKDSAVKSTPAFSTAEVTAHRFLRANSLAEARPYIYHSSGLEPQLQAYYEPIANPGDYDLVFKGRDVLGERSVFFFQVSSGSQVSPVVVLQEAEAFKVFWQFGAGIGEISWADFLKREPSRPVLMRAFLRPDTIYTTDYPPEEWSSWLARDWTGEETARVFCERDSPEERRLFSAMREHSIVRGKERWVMAQVQMQHLGTYSGKGGSLEESAEIVAVPLGSWLPADFVSGSTFYSEDDVIDKPE